MLEHALQWAQDYPEQSIAAFACRYPGQYEDAAKAARQARKELSE